MASDSPTRKLPKTEITTIRLDPKLKYMAELAARKQRRTLSSYIEWAVDQSLRSVTLEEGQNYEDRVSVADAIDRLWDVDESERFVRLAIRYPDLLTHEEQELWKMLSDSGLLHAARFRDGQGQVGWHLPTLEDHVFPAIRSIWAEIKQAAAAGPAARQQWVNETRTLIDPPSAKPKLKQATGGFDDIKF